MSFFYVDHLASPLPTTASPTLQGALKVGFVEAVVACDMHEPCELPSLASCQRSYSSGKISMANNTISRTGCLNSVATCFLREKATKFFHLVLGSLHSVYCEGHIRTKHNLLNYKLNHSSHVTRHFMVEENWGK